MPPTKSKRDKNMKKRIGLKVIVILMLGIPAFAGMSYSQIQPYQLSGTAGYVDTTAYDTVSVPYVKGSNVAGFITNEDETNDLVVYFAKRDSVSRDPNSYVKIGPGKRLKFSFAGRKIFRKASADSVYSQVVFGDGMDLGSGGSKGTTTSIGTATTEYGTCTLNTEWGIVTSDQLPGEGTNECTITVNNSLCKTTSAIVFSVLLLDEGDRNPNTPVTCNISTINDGSFVLRAGKSGGNFSANIVFYYHLQKTNK